jgi:ABC-2 type transport system ATP-binding protein
MRTTGLSASPAPSGASGDGVLGMRRRSWCTCSATSAASSASSCSRSPSSRLWACTWPRPRRRALLVEAAHLLGQGLDAAAQVVALGGQLPLAGVELHDHVDVGRVDPPPGQGGLHLVGLGADRRMSSMGPDGSRRRRTGFHRYAGGCPDRPRAVAGVAVPEAGTAGSSVGPMSAVEVSDLTVDHGSTRAVDGLSFPPTRARCSRCSAPTAPARPPRWRCSRATAGRPRARSGCSGWTRWPTTPRLMPQIGVMLQSGGVYPGIRPSRPSSCSPASTPTPRTPRSCSSGSASPTCAAPPGASSPAASSNGCRWPSRWWAAPVAFLDEPAAGVDVQGPPAHPLALVRDLAHDGACVLLTTHDLDEAETVADRVVIIDHGRLVATGTPQELMARAAADEIRFGAPPGIDTAALGQGADGRGQRGRARRVPGGGRSRRRPTSPPSPAGWPSRTCPSPTCGPVARRLEDVFLHLTSITGEVPAVPEVTLASDGPDDRSGGDRRAGDRRRGRDRRGGRR